MSKKIIVITSKIHKITEPTKDNVVLVIMDEFKQNGKRVVWVCKSFEHINYFETELILAELPKNNGGKV